MPVALIAAHADAGAQPTRFHALHLRDGLPVGAEEEQYLRVLQVAGLAPSYPWSLRGFLPGELPRIRAGHAVHPWQDRFDSADDYADELEVGWVRPEGQLILNSGYPFGENDGALWAGRGLTLGLNGGAYFRKGGLHVRIAPEAFVAQNADFDLAPNGLSGEGAFRDGRFPLHIDAPQRFGNSPYSRVTLGSSAVSLQFHGVGLGVSVAAQQWGPSLHYPLLVSNNAGGFPHLFLQTAHPVSVGIGQIHTRFILGRLAQSEWSPSPAHEPDRFASAVVAVFTPRGLDGLEIGVHRFVHLLWPDDGIGLADVLRPFSTGVNPGTGNVNLAEENQLAGAFLRWVVPSAQAEVYAEFMRDDYARDVRHYFVEPGDISGLTVGVQRIILLSGNRMLALRAEVMNAQLHHSERGDRYRTDHLPWPVYVHLPRVWQGHTLRGQILGSPAAYGGAGWTIGANLYRPGGRWSAEVFRRLRQDWLAGIVEGPGQGAGIADVLYGARLSMMRFVAGSELTITAAPSVSLNRNLVAGNHVSNLNLFVRIRGLPEQKSL